MLYARSGTYRSGTYGPYGEVGTGSYYPAGELNARKPSLQAVVLKLGNAISTAPIFSGLLALTLLLPPSVSLASQAN